MRATRDGRVTAGVPQFMVDVPSISVVRAQLHDWVFGHQATLAIDIFFDNKLTQTRVRDSRRTLIAGALRRRVTCHARAAQTLIEQWVIHRDGRGAAAEQCDAAYLASLVLTLRQLLVLVQALPAREVRRRDRRHMGSLR